MHTAKPGQTESQEDSIFFLTCVVWKSACSGLIHQLHELSSSKILSVVLSSLALHSQLQKYNLSAQLIRSIINYFFVKAQRMFKVFALKERHN